MSLNSEKTKEPRVCFGKQKPRLDPIVIHGTEIKVVPKAKLLGAVFSEDLKRRAQVDFICSKACRDYLSTLLRRARVVLKDLVGMYVTLVRPVVEYTCQDFRVI